MSSKPTRPQDEVDRADRCPFCDYTASSWSEQHRQYHLTAHVADHHTKIRSVASKSPDCFFCFCGERYGEKGVYYIRSFREHLKGKGGLWRHACEVLMNVQEEKAS